jgi:hypothetical protein
MGHFMTVFVFFLRASATHLGEGLFAIDDTTLLALLKPSEDLPLKLLDAGSE